MGFAVKSQEEHPQAADVLINYLREIGFGVEAGVDNQLGKDDIRFVIAAKPN
jgi:hypothetical protein